MKIRITLILVFLAFIGSAYAQPPNDTCGTAQPLTVGVGACNSILYTNVAATTIGNPPTPACWLPNNMSNTVWFSFAATKADIEISTNFAGTLADTQIAVYSGTCGSLTMIGCQEDINTATNLLHTDIILHGLTIGNTYYIIVDGKGNTTGTFGVCVQESIPVGPALAIQDCAGAQNLCGLGNIVVPDGTGGIGFSQESPSCFGAPGERSSSWYSFTAATNGSLCFTITPNNPIDYDFAIYNTTTSCPGTELVCNWEPESGAGITGLGCAGVQCETCLAVTAGQTYSILVDRFTANSSDGFTLNFAGTTTTFASPNPTFTATSPCIGTATQFTNTTNGNFTYSWNFGDGFTSNLENPTHTFATSGPHSVSLLVTAVPGGCQNSVTQPVIVNPLPLVDAGAGTTVCSGGCYTLGGSTTATGFVGTSNFSNNTAFAIPDGSAVGAVSPITVSGILPAAIGAASIASVCINLTHTWDSDLDIFLRCPDGTLMELSTDNGSLDDNYANTCFTPTAATSITTSTGPFTGIFAPEQSFNVLNGCTANGTWELFVQDDLTGDTGNINSWTITFNNNTPAFTWSPTTAMTNANTLTPTVCPTATTTYTLTGNGAGGCVITDQVTVIVGSGATATISYAAPSFCMSAAPQPVTLTGTGTFTGGTFSSTAGLTLNAATGEITPATSTAGIYIVTYTIPASGSCGPTTITANVRIYTAPNAGADGGITVCETSGTISLASLITGEQTGGMWSRTGGIGGVFSATGTFTPALGTSPTNTFVYLITGASVCGNDSSIATVTLSPVIPPLLTCGAATTNSVQFNWTSLIGATGYNVSYQINANPLVVIGPIGNILTYSVNSLNPGDSVTITVTPTGGVGACFAPGSLSCATSNCILPTANISYTGTPFCTSVAAAQAVTLIGTGAFSGGIYSSTSGLTINAATGSITPSSSTAGNYIVTYTIPASAGCAIVTATTSITITALPTATISYTGTPFCTSVTAPQAVTLAGTGAYIGGTYSSTTGLTINAVTGAITPDTSTAGNYTVTYTIPASAGCAVVTTTTPITITALPTATISYAGTPFCNSVSTQAVTLTGTGAYTGGTYSSTAGLTINSVTGAITPSTSTSGNYTVTYTIPASAGCSIVMATASVTITALPTATISYTGTPFCTSVTAPQAVTLTGTGAYNGGTYSSTAGLTINTGTGAITPSTSTIGNYTVTYTIPASAGCAVVKATTPITITALPTAAITYAGTPFCTSVAAAQAVTLIGTGAFSGGIYSSTSGLTINAATGSITPSSSTAGNYIVTYTIPASAGCAIVTATTSITITALPTATISYAGTPFCTSVSVPQAVTLAGTGAYIGGTYSSTTGLTINAVTGAITPDTSTAGNYTVTYTIPASAGCAVVTTTTPITITALPTATISYAGTPFCNSVSTQAVTLTGTGAYTGGTYSSTAGLTINAGTGAITPGTSTAGNYTVTYTIPASAGCAIVTATASITITALPTATIAYTTPFCVLEGTSHNPTLIGTGAYTAGTYASTTGLTINAGTGAITPSTSTVGNYTVTYTVPTNSGCASIIATTFVSINPIVTPVINCGVSTMSSVQFNWTAVTGATDYDVMYSVNTDPPLLIGNIGNVLSYTVSGLNSGDSVIITLTPVGGANSCFASTTQTCSANNCNPPTASINYSATPYCTSINTAQAITISGTGTFNGGIFSAPSGLAINAVTGAITPNICTPGNYTVTYSIPAAAGCSVVTATTSVNIVAIPAAPTLTAIQPTCSLNTGTVTITGATGLTYSFDSGTYSATLIYPGLAAGSTHTVTAKNASGCISLPATIALSTPLLIPATPIAIAVQPTCLLATATITITGIAGLTYSFDNGPYTSTLVHSGLIAGTSHTITAQNAAGCISSASTIALNLQPATPTAPILAPTHPSCAVPTGSIAITGVPGLLYSFDNGAYSGTLVYSGLAAGSAHTVTAQNLAGCVSPSATITLNTPLLTPASPVLVPTHPTCMTATGSISITGIPGLTYSFDNGAYATTLIYNGLAAGTSHTVTAKTSSGCISLPTTIILNAQPITPIAVATPNSRTICSGNSTAIALSGIVGTVFNWTVIQSGVSGGNSGSGSSIAQTLTATSLSQGHAIYTITPFANGCTGLPITVDITVNPLPFASANPTTQTICSGDATNIHLSGDRNETSFDWTIVQIGATGAVAGSGNSITQALTATGITPGMVNYTITPERDGCYGNPIVVTVTVKPTPQVTGTNVFNVCDGDTSNIPLTATVPGTTFTWSVIQNNAIGAVDGNGNAIDQLLNTTAAIPGTAIYTVTPELNGCVGNPFVIRVNVNPIPEPKLVGGIICVDQTTGTATRTYILNSTLSNSAYNFKWYLGGAIIPNATGNTYEADTIGTYSVIATNVVTGCISEQVFATVDAAFIADALNTTVSEAFSENPSIVVTLSNGTGPFLYQLDNSPYQNSNIFTGMSSGMHTVHVTDVNGCTELKKDVWIIDYPHFFTPNGDGYNDTWNIPALSDQLNSRIFIFDRYGKLLKEISPKSQGWDGAYNGHPLPSTDYWFSVDYLETSVNKTFKAHFSLKR